MISENLIKIEKSARYFTLGELTPAVENIWIVLHGYGQLASEFIKNFTSFENERTFIIAPEALNKFYFRGFSCKIGASWMTKEDRENEIEDYINFISTVVEKELKKINKILNSMFKK